MASFSTFLSITTLKNIPTNYLTNILLPIKYRLESDHIWLSDNGNFDYNLVESWLRENANNIDSDILDALFYINGIAKAGIEYKISQELEKLGCAELNDDVSLACKLWDLDKEIVKDLYSQSKIKAQHTFSFYEASITEHKKLNSISKNQLDTIDSTLRRWFFEHNKGRALQLFQEEINDKIYFIIQHGSTLNRTSVIEDDHSCMSVYRLEIEDIIIVDKNTGELRMSIKEQSATLEEMYKMLFSDIFFSEENCYEKKLKFTLDSLFDENITINYGTLRDKINIIKIKKLEYIDRQENSQKVILDGDKCNILEVLSSLEDKSTKVVESLELYLYLPLKREPKKVIVNNESRISYPASCDYDLIDEVLRLNNILPNAPILGKEMSYAKEDLYLLAL